MDDDWLTQALGDRTDIGFDTSLTTKRAEPSDLSDEELETEVVILLQGKNANNDLIYSYLKLRMREVFRLRDAIINKEDFAPSDFGSVLAAGLGQPSPELRSEMAIKYDLVDMKPIKKPANTAFSFAQPAPDMWDD